MVSRIMDSVPLRSRWYKRFGINKKILVSSGLLLTFLYLLHDYGMPRYYIEVISDQGSKQSNWKLQADRNRTITIPWKIWSTSKSRYLSESLKRSTWSWKYLNPTMSWQLDTDEDVLRFLQDDVGGELWNVVQIFINQDAPPVMIADIWRYAILYMHGGIYADVDVSCEKEFQSWFPPAVSKETVAKTAPLDPYSLGKNASTLYEGLRLDDCGIIVGLENGEHFCQWTLASVPGHPLLQNVIELIIERGKNGILVQENFVHYHTGPAVFTDAIIGAFLGADHIGNIKAGALFNKVWTDPAYQAKAKEYRACFMGVDFFNTGVVQNHFASQWTEENEAFSSWREDADNILKKHKQKSQE